MEIHRDADKRERLAEDVTEADLNGFIAAANNAISPFDFEIRSTFHQLTRARTYALINSTSDVLTQLATVHTPDEIGFLKRVLDAMFETHNTPRHEIMAITSMQATRLAKPPAEGRRATQNGTETQGSAGQGLTMMQAEKMLKSLVEEGWFEKSRKGYYSLSPRALMELRGWLFETYNEVEDDEDEADGEGKRIKACMGCKEIITTVSLRGSLRLGFSRSFVTTGTAVRTEELSRPTARYLRPAILSYARLPQLSHLSHRMDWKGLCR